MHVCVVKYCVHDSRPPPLIVREVDLMTAFTHSHALEALFIRVRRPI